MTEFERQTFVATCQTAFRLLGSLLCYFMSEEQINLISLQFLCTPWRKSLTLYSSLNMSPLPPPFPTCAIGTMHASSGCTAKNGRVFSVESSKFTVISSGNFQVYIVLLQCFPSHLCSLVNICEIYQLSKSKFTRGIINWTVLWKLPHNAVLRLFFNIALKLPV